MKREGEGVFIYADPPYKEASELYGFRGSHHRKFKHKEFIESCFLADSLGHKVMVSYDKSDSILGMFDELDPNQKIFKMSDVEFDYTFNIKSRSHVKKTELLITNF